MLRAGDNPTTQIRMKYGLARYCKMVAIERRENERQAGRRAGRFGTHVVGVVVFIIRQLDNSVGALVPETKT